MKILRAASVADKLDIGVSTVWKLLKVDPTFPKPVRISEYLEAQGWYEDEIEAYLAERRRQRDEQKEVRRDCKQVPVNELTT